MSLKSIRGQRGQAVVELTFAFLIFMTIFYAIIEFSHLLYTKVSLQNALRSAGRYMVTGRTGQDGSGNNIPRDQMIHNIFCSQSFCSWNPVSKWLRFSIYLPRPSTCYRLLRRQSRPNRYGHCEPLQTRSDTFFLTILSHGRCSIYA